MTERLKSLNAAKTLAEANELDQAWNIIDKWLTENPDDGEALILGSYTLEKAKKHSVAFHLARRATELRPDKFAAWLNLGWICDQLWRIEESERAHKKAIKCAVNAKEKSLALMNLAALYIQCGEFAKAEPLCRQAVMADPESRKAKANLGFCQLAARNWAEGWDNYASSLGTAVRKKIQYKDEPQWDGTPGLRVALYEDQGLGDSISFASMIPDAIKDSEKVIIDCDPRLTGLYQRSFPQAKVYGTRMEKYLAWDEADRDINASLAMGSLGGIYRRTSESFPGGEAYLKADPDRVAMWQALWKSKTNGRPVIGVAWSGGVKHTASMFRQWSLEEMLPIFRSVDAHFVSLQYKDASKEIEAFKLKHPEIDLVQYSFGTLTKDYDDTAALVDSLDRVISMQTAVVHLAGGLGKKCDVFVPRTSQWRYGEGFTSTPWYKSVNVIRQKTRGEWSSVIQEYVSGKHRAAA